MDSVFVTAAGGVNYSPRQRGGGTENAGLENAGPNRRGGKGRIGKRRTKFLGWKTHDRRLWNAKWISIKTKGTLYDMYILLQI